MPDDRLTCGPCVPPSCGAGTTRKLRMSHPHELPHLGPQVGHVTNCHGCMAPCCRRSSDVATSCAGEVVSSCARLCLSAWARHRSVARLVKCGHMAAAGDDRNAAPVEGPRDWGSAPDATAPCESERRSGATCFSRPATTEAAAMRSKRSVMKRPRRQVLPSKKWNARVASHPGAPPGPKPRPLHHTQSNSVSAHADVFP